MTPEERKAVAKSSHPLTFNSYHERRYLECCNYHEGFDAALALLVRRHVWENVFTIEGTP